MSAAAAPAPAEQPTTPADMSLYEAMKSYGNDTSGWSNAADPAKLAKFEEMLASGHRLSEEELKQAKFQPKNLSDAAEEADSWEDEERADACNAKSSHWSKVLALYAEAAD